MAKTELSIKCAACNIEFKILLERFNEGKKTNRKHYCSSKCQFEAVRKRIDVYCKFCSKLFQATPSQLKFKRKKFCSKTCLLSQKAKNKLPVRKRNRSSEKTDERVNCVRCNKELKTCYKTKIKKLKEKNEILCHSCASKQMHIDHADSYLECRDKIAASVSSEYHALSSEDRQKRVKNWIAAGSFSSKGSSSKLEKLIIPYISGFMHNIGINRITISGFIPDFINEEKKIIIEVNGDYWHANPDKYKPKWHHPTVKLSAEQIWERDKKRKIALEEAGYTVLVIWECDIRKNAEKAVTKILK